MSVVHPSGRTAGRLPLPNIGITIHREMQAAASHRRRRTGNRMWAGMKRSVAGKGYFRRGQQHCKFVFMEAVLVSRLKAVMKHVPSVGSLDERQVFERARRILPYKQEICPPAVVHRATLYSRFAFAVKISSLAGHHGEWHGLSPGPIGCIAVDPGRVG